MKVYVYGHDDAWISFSREERGKDFYLKLLGTLDLPIEPVKKGKVNFNKNGLCTATTQSKCKYYERIYVWAIGLDKSKRISWCQYHLQKRKCHYRKAGVEIE